MRVAITKNKELRLKPSKILDEIKGKTDIKFVVAERIRQIYAVKPQAGSGNTRGKNGC